MIKKIKIAMTERDFLNCQSIVQRGFDDSGVCGTMMDLYNGCGKKIELALRDIDIDDINVTIVGGLDTTKIFRSIMKIVENK